MSRWSGVRVGRGGKVNQGYSGVSRGSKLACVCTMMQTTASALARRTSDKCLAKGRGFATPALEMLSIYKLVSRCQGSLTSSVFNRASLASFPPRPRIQVVEVRLPGNNAHGVLPPSLGSLSELRNMELRENRFEGGRRFFLAVVELLHCNFLLPE